jgi:hypothetical protein
VTPNGRYALVSNYDLKTIYRVDLLDPADPCSAGSVSIGFPAEDIAIAPNSQFALITDGDGENKVAIIDLTSFSLTATHTMTTPGAHVLAVAIAPDSQTVILCDYHNDRIIYGAVNPATGLTSELTLPTGFFPVNVAISPDGQTVLVANSWHDDPPATDFTVSVFQITGPGAVAPGVTPTVAGLPGGQQSIAFSPDSKKAYVVSMTPDPDQLSSLIVNGPGNVSLGVSGAANLLSQAGGHVFGVDVLAVTPDGAYALAGNPDDDYGTPSNDVAFVNLSDWSVATLNTNSTYPMGLSVFNQYPVNYVELRVKPNAAGNYDFKQGDQVLLEWNTFEYRYGYENAPCLIYLGAAQSPVAEDTAVTVPQITGSRVLYLFDSRQRASRYNPRSVKPTYSNVAFPNIRYGSSGELSFKVPGGATGRWVFATAFSRMDGRGFPADPPVEVSNGFNLQ